MIFFRKLFLILAILLLPIFNVFPLTLAWDASPDANVTGYNIYYGTNSGIWPSKVNAGTNLTLIISNTNFVNGTTYYFIATAYTVDGVESLPSNEVSYDAANYYPTISIISDKIIYANQTAPKIIFFINDTNSPITNLTTSISFTNNLLFSSNSFLFTGSNTNRNLYITPKPNSIGADRLQITVKNLSGFSVTNSFDVSVINYVNIIYIATILEYGTNLANLQSTNINLVAFTNPVPGQFYRQSLIITNHPF